jgi:hypothetical protein
MEHAKIAKAQRPQRKKDQFTFSSLRSFRLRDLCVAVSP